jgi:hypothetical protein
MISQSSNSDIAAASTPNYYLQETSTQALINFFAEATSIGLSEFYKARHECTLARYALRDRVTVYDQLRLFLNKQATANPKEAFLLLGKLDDAAERLVGTVDRVVGILKKAAEIDIITSTRFDGIQLYHLIQQIPTVIVTLIQEVLEVQCELFCDCVLDEVQQASTVEDNEAVKKTRKHIKQHIPVFAASVAKEIGEKLSLELQTKLKVVSVNDAVVNSEENSSDTNNSRGVDEKIVEGMLETVPEYNNGSNGDEKN